MDKGDDPIAAFGSAEEGDEPLLPYIDAQERHKKSNWLPFLMRLL